MSGMSISHLTTMMIATALGLPANIAVMVVSVVQFQHQAEISQTCLIFNLALAGEFKKPYKIAKMKFRRTDIASGCISYTGVLQYRLYKVHTKRQH